MKRGITCSSKSSDSLPKAKPGYNFCLFVNDSTDPNEAVSIEVEVAIQDRKDEPLQDVE